MHPAGRHLNAEISPFRFGHQMSLGHDVRHVRRQYHVPVTQSFIVEKRDEKKQKQPAAIDEIALPNNNFVVRTFLPVNVHVVFVLRRVFYVFPRHVDVERERHSG